ncbi:MAG: twin-arginine translocase subunit TatC [Bacteroidales bacterium]|nr:twin-arginine translocase subunit TatC [Bacteroidales bacterium]
MTATNNNELSFWEHLDELRSCIVRIGVSIIVCSLLAFCFKDLLFSIVLAPKNADFVTYRLFELLGAEVDSFSVNLINTELAQQFLIHVKISFFAGTLLMSPYILFVLFRFISPALYSTEKRVAVKAVGAGYIMFILGVALSYFLIFPLTFHFLGTYQVSAEVVNFISLSSYIGTLLLLCLLMGILFEIPILCWILARLGFIKADLMRKYRRHAIVAICIIAAIITPTADAFTLFVVALPIYLLYELSICIVRRSEKRGDN